MNRLWIACCFVPVTIAGAQSARAGDYVQEYYNETVTPYAETYTANSSSGVGSSYYTAISYSKASFSGAGSVGTVNIASPSATSTYEVEAKWYWVPNPYYAYYGMVDNPVTYYVKKTGGYGWYLKSHVQLDGTPTGGLPYADALAEFDVNGTTDSKSASGVSGTNGDDVGGVTLPSTESTGSGTFIKTATASVTSRTALSMPSGSSGMASAESGEGLGNGPNRNTASTSLAGS